MISTWHLAWIIPLSVWAGVLLIALVSGRRGDDDAREALALLKEQEATEYVDDGLDSVNGKIATRYRCKFCGQTMTCEFEKSPEKFVTYCIRCGRKVKWDA